MKKEIIKKIFRIFYRILLALVIFVFIIFVIFTAPYWWRHWVTYPCLEKERAELWTRYQKPQKFITLEEYQGVLHVHSYWSHDSRGVIKEILPAAKKAKLQFIFFADHPHAKLDTFPRAYHGIYDGIIFESGTETHSGLMVCPMDSMVLDWHQDQGQIIKQVISSGGLVLYVHTEDPHDWDNPDYQGMEIYNIHTDLLDENSELPILINAAINKSKYHHWVYRELYDDQKNILARWDSLNRQRRIVGVSAVDAHNNQNYRARYTQEGLVEWVGPNAKTIIIREACWKEKLLLGEADSAGWVFKWDVDPYFQSFNYVNNHVFSDTLTRVDIKNNLVRGHAFISFENLAEARGFQFFSMDSNNTVNAIMGDSVIAKNIRELRALSPFPVLFQLIKNGKIIDRIEDVYEYRFNPRSGPGNYRIVASVKLNDIWIPWVFTNAIYVY